MRRSLGQHVGWLLLVAVSLAAQVLASFSGTEVIVPSVGRGPGSQSSQWYTTVWIHNPGSQVAAVQVYFLERGTANPSPRVKQLQVPPEVTYRITNAVESLFNLTNSFGAFRIVASQKVYVNARVYSQVAGDTEAETVGQFFAAAPASFAIGAGQTTEVLGVYQTNPQSASLYRYNFGLVETAGGTATVHVDAANQTGGYVGSKDYTLGPFGALQVSIKDLLPAVNSDNLRLHVTVQPGSAGRVIAYGSGLANQSNDPSTFEMQYRDELLGGEGGGLTVVDHDATLQGDGTSAHPLGVADEAITTAKLSATGSTAGQVLTSDGAHVDWQTPTTGGSGLSAVAHDATLSGSGTNADVLRIAAGGVGSPQLATGAVTTEKVGTAGGSNGQVLTVTATGAAWLNGGLTLPYTGLVSTAGGAFDITNQSGSTDTVALRGTTTNGVAVSGSSTAGIGVFGGSTNAQGVFGRSASSDGLYGESMVGVGIHGTAGGQRPAVLGESTATDDGIGVAGAALGGTNACGVLGMAGPGQGVRGTAESGIGVYGGSEDDAGVWGKSYDGPGVRGDSSNGDGLAGSSSHSRGVFGQSSTGVGVRGSGGTIGVHGSGAVGVLGEGMENGVRGYGNGDGVFGESDYGEGVHGKSTSGDGLFGEASAADRSGVFALTTSPSGYAGAFNGRVVVHGDLHVDGNISKGGGSFRIDHPLDPENRYLSHSFVESPDMKNVYDGVVTTDESGLAVVLLPAWFEALNRDFRYQLTVIGRFAQAIVLREIEGNAFAIQTNLANVKVSWQVTGIRKDPYAEQRRIAVEEDKPERERGTYLHPDAYGQPEEKGIEWVRHPEVMQRLKAEREAGPGSQR